MIIDKILCVLDFELKIHIVFEPHAGHKLTGLTQSTSLQKWIQTSIFGTLTLVLLYYVHLNPVSAHSEHLKF